MNNEAHQSVFFQYGLNLLLPQIDGTLVEKVQEHVVLGGSNWKFNNVTNEMMHHSAISATLGSRWATFGIASPLPLRGGSFFESSRWQIR
jgi:hypothetical protein